jgi:hypothetical protein
MKLEFFQYLNRWFILDKMLLDFKANFVCNSSSFYRGYKFPFHHRLAVCYVLVYKVYFDIKSKLGNSGCSEWIRLGFKFPSQQEQKKGLIDQIEGPCLLVYQIIPTKFMWMRNVFGLHLNIYVGRTFYPHWLEGGV